MAALLVMEDGPTTTAADVVALFAVTDAARRAYRRWSTAPTQRRVVSHVSGHVTHTVYRLWPKDIDAVARATHHALGPVQKKVAESIQEIVNWRPDYAFMFVFHYLLEHYGCLFTYQELCHLCAHDPMAIQMLSDPARALQADLLAAGEDPGAVMDGLRWRIGNAYYSFLREMHVVAHLRAMGRDVRVHPLADALFRVDGWEGRTVLTLCVGNNRFRAGDEGRKLQARVLLGAAQPPFRFRHVELPAPKKHGYVLLASIPQIQEIADLLHRECVAPT